MWLWLGSKHGEGGAGVALRRSKGCHDGLECCGFGHAVHFGKECLMWLEMVIWGLQEVVTRSCVQREGVGASEGHCAIVAIVCCLLLCTTSSCCATGGELPFRVRFASVDSKNLVGSGAAGQLDTSGSTSIHDSPLTLAKEAPPLLHQRSSLTTQSPRHGGRRRRFLRLDQTRGTTARSRGRWRRGRC